MPPRRTKLNVNLAPQMEMRPTKQPALQMGTSSPTPRCRIRMSHPCTMGQLDQTKSTGQVFPRPRLTTQRLTFTQSSIIPSFQMSSIVFPQADCNLMTPETRDFLNQAWKTWMFVLNTRCQLIGYPCGSFGVASGDHHALVSSRISTALSARSVTSAVRFMR